VCKGTKKIKNAKKVSQENPTPIRKKSQQMFTKFKLKRELRHIETSFYFYQIIFHCTYKPTII